MSSLVRPAYGYTNLAGLQFGEITVLGNGTVVGKNRKVPTKCSCGTTKDIFFQSLIRGTSTNCGCKSAQKSAVRAIKIPRLTLAHGIAAKNALFCQYRGNARERNLPFELTKEQFFDLTKQVCSYCDREPSTEIKTQYKTGTYIYNGIDRVDNDRGYTVENSIPCCKQCNIAKNNMTIEEFKSWILRLYRKMYK